MQFRWVVGLTLWTMLIGPILGPPMPRSGDSAAARPTAVKKPLPQAAGSTVRR